MLFRIFSIQVLYSLAGLRSLKLVRLFFLLGKDQTAPDLKNIHRGRHKFKPSSRSSLLHFLYMPWLVTAEASRASIGACSRLQSHVASVVLAPNYASTQSQTECGHNSTQLGPDSPSLFFALAPDHAHPLFSHCLCLLDGSSCAPSHAVATPSSRPL